MDMMRRSLGRPFGFDGDNFSFYFWFTGWTHISLGFHVDLKGMVEIHVPFGFVRIGRP